MDNLENGVLLYDDERETVSREDRDYYWQDDIRKDEQIQADLEELNKK